MVALAWLYGASAPVPAFILISRRIGPLTTAIAAIELVVLPRALTPVAASARITGKYSDRSPGERVLPVDVRAQLTGRLAHDRLRDEHLPEPGHAVDRGHRPDDPVELVGVHGDGGNTVLRFDRHRVRGDRRRAGASVSDADDRGVPPRLDLLPRGRVIVEVHARNRLEDRPHSGHVLGEPRLHL